MHQVKENRVNIQNTTEYETKTMVLETLYAHFTWALGQKLTKCMCQRSIAQEIHTCQHKP